MPQQGKINVKIIHSHGIFMRLIVIAFDENEIIQAEDGNEYLCYSPDDKLLFNRYKLKNEDGQKILQLNHDYRVEEITKHKYNAIEWVWSIIYLYENELRNLYRFISEVNSSEFENKNKKIVLINFLKIHTILEDLMKINIDKTFIYNAHKYLLKNPYIVFQKNQLICRTLEAVIFHKKLNRNGYKSPFDAIDRENIYCQ